MRLRLSLVLLLAHFPFPISPFPFRQADVVITGVTVIDASGTPPAIRTVVVRDGKIVSLLQTGGAVPPSARILSGSGKFLIPGLWDMHVHLATSPEPHLAEQIMLPLFLAHGVVGVRDMGGPLERVLDLRDRVARGALPGPAILTPGPFIDGPGDADPMFRRANTTDDARRSVRELAAAGVDFIKVQANLSREAYDAVVREARERQKPVAGHVPVAMSASDTVGTGQRSIEHVSPALVGDAGLLFACSSREVDLRSELLAIERGRPSSDRNVIREREASLRAQLIATYDPDRAAVFGARLRAAGMWIVPTLIWSNSLRPLAADDDGASLPMDYVPAATRERWRTNRSAYLKAAPPAAFEAAAAVTRGSARAVGALHAAGAPVLAGTDTFDAFVLPGVSLHQELALLVNAGLTPLEALQAATRNAAEYRGVLAHEGTIASGNRADLVLLDGNPLADIRNVGRIAAVIQGGRLLTRTDLDVLLESVRTAAASRAPRFPVLDPQQSIDE